MVLLNLKQFFQKSVFRGKFCKLFSGVWITPKVLSRIVLYLLMNLVVANQFCTQVHFICLFFFKKRRLEVVLRELIEVRWLGILTFGWAWMVVIYANICIGFPTLIAHNKCQSHSFERNLPDKLLLSQDHQQAKYCLKEKEIAFALICSCFLFCLEPEVRDSTHFGFAHFASSVFSADHSHTGRRPTLP